MATDEKENQSKDLKDNEDKIPFNDELKFNISEEDQKEDENDLSKLNKNIKEDLSDSKSEISQHKSIDNSNIIKINDNFQDNDQNPINLKNSEMKSSNNLKDDEKQEEENNKSNISQDKDEGGGQGSNSSFLNKNNDLDNNKDVTENNDNEDSKVNYLSRNKHFLTKGKFMQIRPHFRIFNKQITDLHEGIYENTKKCLIYKSSLQDSENLIRENANSVVKDLVNKIFNLRQMFLNANKMISNNIKEVDKKLIKVTEEQSKSKKEINDCEHRINICERQIGYKLLGKPSYSFMQKFYSTTVAK